MSACFPSQGVFARRHSVRGKQAPPQESDEGVVLSIHALSLKKDMGVLCLLKNWGLLLYHYFFCHITKLGSFSTSKLWAIESAL